MKGSFIYQNKMSYAHKPKLTRCNAMDIHQMNSTAEVAKVLKETPKTSKTRDSGERHGLRPPMKPRVLFPEGQFSLDNKLSK